MKTDLRYIKAKFDLGQAERQFQDAFTRTLATSRKEASTLFRQEAKGVMRFVFAVTPPMGGKAASLVIGKNIRVDFAGGKKAGKANILADVDKALAVKGRARNRYGPDEALAFYLRRRNDRKRIRGKSELPVTGRAKVFVRTEILKRQGWVASGWNSAARALGFSAPGWINRWGSALNQRFTAVWEGDFPFFEAVNGTNHRDSDNINRRIAIAVRMQANVMERRLKAAAEKKAFR